MKDSTLPTQVEDQESVIWNLGRWIFSRSSSLNGDLLPIGPVTASVVPSGSLLILLKPPSNTCCLHYCLISKVSLGYFWSFIDTDLFQGSLWLSRVVVAVELRTGVSMFASDNCRVVNFLMFGIFNPTVWRIITINQ